MAPDVQPASAQDAETQSEDGLNGHLFAFDEVDEKGEEGKGL